MMIGNSSRRSSFSTAWLRTELLTFIIWDDDYHCLSDMMPEIVDNVVSGLRLTFGDEIKNFRDFDMGGFKLL